MSRPSFRYCSLAAIVLLHCLALGVAGPVGSPTPHPEAGLVEHHEAGDDTGVCTVGGTAYSPGAAVPGAGACDNCTCGADGRVRCARARCEPRPGCKALHRPDHCCPTYQCECEQDGRRYGNGEKLVDPEDPCRVCYCQGGEVVCRRIACFRRDDCRPRHVAGRCCPEYDHCPLRGVSTVTGSTASLNVTSSTETAENLAPAPPNTVKQEITIKEITPVSEIPVITEVKIKEVPPSPTAQDAVSSHAPITQRQTENPYVPSTPHNPQPDSKVSTDSSTDDSSQPVHAVDSSTKMETVHDNASGGTIQPSITTAAAAGSITEEEDPTLFEHNPAFPPLPDDLSVLTDREDDSGGEHQTSDVTRGTPAANAPSSTVGTIAPADLVTPIVIGERKQDDVSSLKTKDDVPAESRSVSKSDHSNVLTTTRVDVYPTKRTEEVTRDASAGRAPFNARPLEVESTPLPTDFERQTTVSIDDASVQDSTTHRVGIIPDTPNLSTDARYLIVTTGDVVNETPVVPDSSDATDIFITTDALVNLETAVVTTNVPTANGSSVVTEGPILTDEPIVTNAPVAMDGSTVTHVSIIKDSFPNMTSGPASNLDTESNSAKIVETFFSQSTSAVSTSFDAERDLESTEGPNVDDADATEIAQSSETITEEGTTETAFHATSRPSRPNKNIFADLIDLVGDVASIGERADRRRPPTVASFDNSAPTAVADSEEFIPVNAGYKSKNSNTNSNSITEEPDKVGRRSGAVELEDDEPEGPTEAQRSGARAEPTTRPPLIDRVTAGAQPIRAKDEIEIITQAYVPGLARRPTKVVLGEPETPASAPDAAAAQ